MIHSELVELLGRAPAVDAASKTAVADRAFSTLRPKGALARLDEVAAWLGGWQRTITPEVSSPALLLAAADHGVTGRGVSAYPWEVTRAVVSAIDAGVATSSVLARHVGAEVVLVDAGVGEPTGDIVEEPALSPEAFKGRFEQGREAVAELRCDLLAVGEMGIGNSTAAAAVAAAIVGGDPVAWVGPGTGVEAEALEGKRRCVAAAVKRVGEVEPMEALRQLGGGELVALAGAVTEARLRSIPVVLDGFISTAAVMPMAAAVTGALDHCLASHLSTEPGHRRALDWLGLQPLLQLDMRLGEGSGALLAIPLIALAAASVTEVATFEEWGLA